jgi:hypothetical protein
MALYFRKKLKHSSIKITNFIENLTSRMILTTSKVGSGILVNFKVEMAEFHFRKKRGNFAVCPSRFMIQY